MSHPAIELAQLLKLPDDGRDTVDPEVADMLAMPKGAVSHATWSARTSQEQMAYIKAEVCERLANGESTKHIYASLGTTHKQINNWMATDAKFKGEFAQARELNNEILAEKLEDVHAGHFNPAMAKIESDNIKWLLGVRDRSKYGTKVDVTDNSSSQLVDVLRMAISRIPRPQPSNERPTSLIDQQAVDITELT